MIILIPLPYVSEIISLLVQFLVNSLNFITEQVSNFPLSVSRNIYLSGGDVILIYCIILLIFILLLTKKIRILAFILSIIAIFQINNLIQTNKMIIGRQFIIWNCPTDNIHFIEGEKSLLFSEKFNANNKYGILALARKYSSINLSKNPDTINIKKIYESTIRIKKTGIYSINGIVWFNGKKILLLAENNTLETTTIKIPDIDFLIILGKPEINIDNLVFAGKPGEIIIGANVPEWIIHPILSQARTLNISTHSVKTDGAFIYTFK